MAESPKTHVETLIVGAGFSGIGTAVMLDRAGLGDYLIVEAGDGAGGTWYWNTYPGIAVDIPSFSYQFSFEQSPNWSRTYAPGHELRAYAEHCVAKYGLAQRIRLSTTVREARFNDNDHLWRVDTDGGEITARYLINASGVLTVPNFPDIDGVGSFGGITMHTARWDHDHDLVGKRVGVIGTGASAVQVIPEIAGKVQRLSVFQRTPIWCFPKFDVPLPKPIRLAMRIPGGRAVQRLLSQAFVEVTFPLAANYFTLNPFADRIPDIGKAFLRRQVRDPQVRDKLTPRYAVGCKRPSFHNSYLSTFNRDNVELVTEPISNITGSGVATADGRRHDIDVLILATGFKVMDADSSPTFPVIRPDGTTLRQFWEDNRLQAYEGVSIPGFPNMFTVFGPYGYVGSSYFALIEAQTHHIVRCLTAARRQSATRIEVRREANDRFFADMLRKRRRQIFWQDTCHLANSYYFDKNGDVPLRPSSTLEAYWHSRRFPLGDYQFSARSQNSASRRVGGDI